MKAIRWELDSLPKKAMPFVDDEVYIETYTGSYVADFRLSCVTEAPFRVPQPFVGGYGFIEHHDGLTLLGPGGKKIASWGMKDEKHWVYPCAPFSQGLCAMITRDNRFGFMNTKGEMVVEPTCAMAMDFTEGHARVLTGKKNGRQTVRLIDTKGRTVLKSDAHYLSGVHNGCCIELLDRGTLRLWHGFDTGFLKSKEIRVHGEIFFEQDWQGESLIPYQGQRFVSDDDMGLICLKTGEVGPMSWRKAAMSRCGRSYVEDRYGVTFVDEALTPMPDASKKDNRQSLMDILGGKKSGVRYFTMAQYFSEDLCAVKNGHNRWSYIDVDGAEAFAGRFEMAMMMHGGVALVYSDGLWSAIDRKGRRARQDFLWEELWTFGDQDAYFMVKTSEHIAYTGEKRYAQYLVSRKSLTEC